MAKLRATNIDPKTATTLTLGATGDSVTFASTETRANTFKDAGGNTLFTSDGAGNLSGVNEALSGGGWKKLASYTIADGTTSVFYAGGGGGTRFSGTSGQGSGGQGGGGQGGKGIVIVAY